MPTHARRAIASVAIALLLGTTLHAQAQHSNQRVEITGSAIRRIDTESALPVPVLKREDIVRSGDTFIVDLLQRLAAVQGSTHLASQVRPNTFGAAGVWPHNSNETRTLVRLNGRHLAQLGRQTLTGTADAFDLKAIPVSAIERVEILTLDPRHRPT